MISCVKESEYFKTECELCLTVQTKRLLIFLHEGKHLATRFIALALFVQKYGGTSVGSLERIKAIADHLASIYHQGHKLVVVVSAMGQQTDDLLEMALTLNQSPPQREVDMLLSAGERISMSLLAIALSNLGIPTVSFTGSQSGILTDNTFGNARIKKILGHRVRDALDQKKLVIVAGFQGMSDQEKEITTLGRGGSDLTAIALAHSLNADRCQIFKDVDGVCSADPRIAPHAKLIPYLSWDALSNLTWFGSGVVHNRGVHLAKIFNIQLEIRSSFNLSNRGTTVGSHQKVENAVIYAITQKKDLSWIAVQNLPLEYSHKIFLNLVSLGETPIYFQHSTQETVPTLELVASRKLIAFVHKHLAEISSTSTIAVKSDNLGCITIVGDGFWQDTTVLERATYVIGSESILLDCKNSYLNLFTKGEKTQSLVQELHAAFFNA